MTRWGWRCLAFVVATRLIMAAVFPVMPEETYHWDYSRHLDWGYYDHPPMVAWAIGAGTALLGANRLGVRLVPLLFSIGTTLVLAALARRLYGRRAADWSILLLAVEPAAGVGSWGFPDSPLLFFWALTLLAVWQSLESGRGAWWLAAGAALGAGMLSKYTAAFLVPSVLGYLVFSRRDRRWLGTPWPYLAGVVSLVVFLPVVYWNWQHDWASFRFQGPDRFQRATAGFSVLDGLFSVAEQWLFILPMTLPLAAAALVGLLRGRQPRDQFLLWSFAPMAGFFLIMGMTPSFHLLWPYPAYLAMTVAMAGAAAEPAGRVSRAYAARPAWLAGAVGATLLGATAYAGGMIPFLPPVGGPFGWSEVAERVRVEAAKMPPGSFYVGLSARPYACASELAFYLGVPVKANDIVGMEALQYRFWDEPARLEGRDALIVVEGGMRCGAPALLPRWFDKVELIGEVKTEPAPGCNPVHCYLFRAHGYRPNPSEPPLDLPVANGPTPRVSD